MARSEASGPPLLGKLRKMGEATMMTMPISDSLSANPYEDAARTPERSEASGPRVNYWSFRVDTTRGPWHVTIATEARQEAAMVTTILLLGKLRPPGSPLAFTGIRALKAEVTSDRSVIIPEDGHPQATEQVWMDMGYTPEQYREARRLAAEKYGASAKT